MPNNESVGKKIVEALKKQAENMDMQEEQMNDFSSASDDIFASSTPATTEDDFFAEPAKPAKTTNFFDDIEEEKDPFFAERICFITDITATLSVFILFSYMTLRGKTNVTPLCIAAVMLILCCKNAHDSVKS